MSTERAPMAPVKGPGSVEETRRNRRHTLVTAATLWRATMPSAEEGVRIFVSNVSMDGMAFRSRAEFEPGAVHYVKLAAGPLRLEGQIRIAWCRPHDQNTFDTGAAFITR